MRLAAVVLLTACATAQPTLLPRTDETLAGAWTVDLSVDPTKPAYTKPMHLSLNADGTVSGDFYESEILAGRWKTDRGRTCVSFRTTDGAGPYHTAACLAGDRVQGQAELFFAHLEPGEGVPKLFETDELLRWLDQMHIYEVGRDEAGNPLARPDW